ncbi:CapA family protein [Brevibacillus sp. B_LB10_24]|uniref:CapA family protein n=1 Tax=Brevibacillus sp. B_LB10_24 TaxID=3380645 RepID=UPI0038B7E140
MNQTRTERVKLERKRRRRRRSSYLLPQIMLLGAVLLTAGFLLQAQDAFTAIARLFQPDDSGQPAKHTAEPDSEDPAVNLTFVGDVIFSGHVERMLKENGYDYPYTHVSSLLGQDDYTVANLETPVTKRGVPAQDKDFVYKSPPEAIPALKAAGVDLVNLANNHSMDQGVEGLLDTFAVLQENEIEYVGAGADIDRAYAPVYVERGGIKLAFLGFSRIVPEVSWYAGKNKPGVAATYDPARAVQAIRGAKEQADLVIVIAHWGKERVDFPVDYQKELARAYIDAGADLIVGGHPHVLQGFESYKNKWIAYSLGNFIFTRATVPKTWETMVLQAKCTNAGACELKMLPYYAELGRAVPMNEQDGAALLQRIESISTNVRIEPDGSVREKQ